MVFHFDLRINSFFYCWIVDDAPFKQKVHVNLVVFSTCLLFEQKKVNHVAHLLALIYFECSDRLASLFIRDQISA